MTGGPKGYWQALLDFAKKGAEIDPEIRAPFIRNGWIQAQVGDKDRAFEYLERSFEQRDVDILKLNDPMLAPIRSDPRFKDLVRRIGLPE